MGRKSVEAARGGSEAASFEFLIGMAAMLAAKDGSSQLKAMKEMLEKLKHQKAEWRDHRDCRKGYALAVLNDATRIKQLSNLLADTLEEFGIDEIRRDIESLSEMGEMESLRLQMAMDRLNKMMSTLSNLLKKVSETSAAITANLK